MPGVQRRGPGHLKLPLCHSVPLGDVTPMQATCSSWPSPPSPSRERAKSPWLQERGSSKGKRKGTAHVPCPLSGQGVPRRRMSAWLALPWDPQQDEPPLAKDQRSPCLWVQIPGDPPKPSPSLRPLQTLSAGPLAAALSHGAALTGGPKQAAAGLHQHGRRGGREITEDCKKPKFKKMEIMLKLTGKNRACHAS